MISKFENKKVTQCNIFWLVICKTL